ncbi:MAG: ATP-binding cassette domain-containing protein [Clostridia bacterium]|nr:ATP-binding cassette domain-containing protein [Clostridia bacterium]
MIELKNITYEVEERGQKKVILNNVSCVFEDNCFVAITGHNGSGKSTLTKLIVGILKPTNGKILLNGKDITDLSITERARLGLNYAFQQPVTFSGITIKELIDIATNEQNSIPKACEYLSAVGLCAKEYVNRNFDKTLSGGEQKRIELALALAKKGNCLIFDEPEAGIDLWSFEKLSSLFNQNKTYVVVSHQEKLLSRADKILVMQNGEILKYDDSKKIIKNLPKACGKINGGKQ